MSSLLSLGQAGLEVLGQVHQHKAGGVPQLIGKVAGSLHLLLAVTHIVARGGAVHQHEAQCIRAVLGNDLQRVDAVAQALGHLAALAVADDAVDADSVEGSLAGVGQTGEDHAADPETDDVVAGDQRVGGVEILQVRAVLVGPAQSAERPQSGGEPGIQRIGVLGEAGCCRTWGRCRASPWRPRSRRSHRSSRPGSGGPTTADG